MIGNIFLIINAISCFGIATRLMFFQKKDGQHRWGVSILAYIMISCAAYIFFNIITGNYTEAQPAEAIFNLIVMLALFRAKGNLSKIIPILQV